MILARFEGKTMQCFSLSGSFCTKNDCAGKMGGENKLLICSPYLHQMVQKSQKIFPVPSCQKTSGSHFNIMKVTKFNVHLFNFNHHVLYPVYPMVEHKPYCLLEVQYWCCSTMIIHSYSISLKP
jgi:hypothetical protein